MASPTAKARKRRVKAVQPSRVLIVDDHPLVRQGLAQLIESEPGLVVCGQAESVTEALRLFDSTRPDLTLTDLSLSKMDGMELIHQIRARDPASRILVVSVHDEALYAERALRAGARGYISEQEPAQVVRRAIHAVLEGRVFVTSKVTQGFLNRMASGADSERGEVETLSDRELEVFRLLGNGLTTHEIAEQLMLSAKTAETYRDRIRAKLKVKNHNQLLVFAARWVAEHP